jgi:hypothetical protein
VKKFLIVLLDEMLFRPAVAVLNWQPSRRKPCTCSDCHRDIDCLVFNEMPVSKERQPSDYDWPTIDRIKRVDTEYKLKQQSRDWRGKNYGM